MPDRNQRPSCFQAIIKKSNSENSRLDKIVKFKFYNKTIDYLQKGTTGFSIGCNMHKILCTPKNQDPTVSLHILKAWLRGQSRVEMSCYYK